MSAPEKAFPTFVRVGPSLGRWLLRAVVLTFVVLVLYVLSIGPALQLNKRGIMSPETFERLYFPLSFINIPSTQRLLDGYMRLWADPGPEPR